MRSRRGSRFSGSSSGNDNARTSRINSGAARDSVWRARKVRGIVGDSSESPLSPVLGGEGSTVLRYPHVGRAVQVAAEPIAAQPGHLFKRPRFLEEMTGAGHD